MPAKLLIKSGDKFGRLVVLKEIKQKNKSRYFLCKCDCGKTTERCIKALIKNSISSCGCYQNEFNIKPRYKQRSDNYPYLKSRLYSIWTDIKKRCNNTNTRAYKWYGAKGVKVCETWENDFINFMNWSIKNNYSDELTIDRINSNGNYSPDNCRWVSMLVQNNNKSSNRLIEFENQQYTMSQLSRLLGVKYTTLVSKLNKGLTVKEIIRWNLEYSQRDQ
jgi:hypothetical protein